MWKSNHYITSFVNNVKHCHHRALFIHVWFADQTIKPLEIEDNADITLIIENNIKIEY